MEILAWAFLGSVVGAVLMDVTEAPVILLLSSDFGALISDVLLLSSDFGALISDVLLPSSDFGALSSDVLLLSSAAGALSSDVPPLPIDFADGRKFNATSRQCWACQSNVSHTT